MKDKIILITGGTGTLGQEIVRQLIPMNPKLIKIFSRSEYEQSEMKRQYPDCRYIIGDIRDKVMLGRAMNGVEICIHCAALKRVENCEENPDEAILTNVMGSQNVISSCLSRGVAKCIGISSDKAVNAENAYGVTKKLMEKLFLHANIHCGTKFSIIRFGNFGASRGNVRELWMRQSAQGKITVTDRDMVRYWIDEEKAAHFTLDSLERMKGGEILIPKMPAKKMEELARELAPKCEIITIGNRGNEKKSEDLWSESEKSVDKGDYWVI